jgi:hypothetical protein
LNYTAEILDRATGELVEVDQGNWVTVTELGKAHGVGPRRVRAVLHHMGLLRSEGKHGRYRLAPFAVERGYGKRIDRPKRSKWPFDVLSPEGQRLIDETWEVTVADMQSDLEKDSSTGTASTALDHFKKARSRPMETQEEVCWLRDHQSGLTNTQIATVTGASEQLVGRYVALQLRQRQELRRGIKNLPPQITWWEALRRRASDKARARSPPHVFAPLKRLKPSTDQKGEQPPVNRLPLTTNQPR